MSPLLLAPHPESILLESSQPELRMLVVTVTSDKIEIRGQVSSYYLKQLAQESIRCAMEGRRLVNRVVVESPQAVSRRVNQLVSMSSSSALSN